MDKGFFVPSRREGRAKEPNPPVPLPPRRPNMPPFEEVEKVEYPVPEDLLSEPAAIVEIYHKIAVEYDAVATYRKSIYECRRKHIKDAVSFNKYTAYTKQKIDEHRQSAKLLRDEIEELGGKGFDEPKCFKDSI
uniref:Uncharacterized protein n=1 Tax=Oryza meridionalis TaxID=40149 RepID=A0A0E0EF51_9ORYZ